MSLPLSRPTLLQNLHLVDPESGTATPGWLRLHNGQIAERGSSPVKPSADEVLVDCTGAWLLPGIFDAHVHFVMGGEFLDQLDASLYHNRDDLLEEISRRAAQADPNPGNRSSWILGFGLNQSEALPSLDALDAATGDVPLRLETHDLHSSLCNTAALRRAGIHRDTPDPVGGELGRDAAGKLTGFLRENAAYLMRPALPAASPAERRQYFLRAQEHAHRLGITGVGENLRRADLPVLQELEQQGQLGMRIQGWRNDGNMVMDTLDLDKFTSDFIRVDTAKAFVDGALGSRTAAMSLPYEDGSYGNMVADAEQLLNWMRPAISKGWRIALHVIGDSAVSQVIDHFELLAGEGLPVTGWRHRLEHVQFLKPEDRLRMARLELIASLQPLHAGSDQDHFAGLVTAEQRAIGYPWKSILDAGIRMPLGTDWPVEALDPSQNLIDGISRRSRKGKSLLGSGEALSARQMLKGMTHEAARCAGFPECGHLQPGACADLVLLAENPLEFLPTKDATMKVMSTWSAGRLVYQNKDSV